MGQYTVGDVILCGAKAQGLVSRAIKLGSWLRGYPKAARAFSHTALIIDTDGTIAEAASKGVRRAHVSKYHADDIRHVHTHVDEHDQAQVLAFAEAVMAARTGYGFVTFAGLALYCLTGGSLCVQKAGTAICSGFVADALTRAGEIFERPPYACMPADLAVHFDVT
jgi:hypothetical protein